MKDIDKTQILRKILKNWSLQFNTFNFLMMEQYWNNKRLKRQNYDNSYSLFCYVKVLPLQRDNSWNCSSKLHCEACFFFHPIVNQPYMIKAGVFCNIWSIVLKVAFFKKSPYLSCIYYSLFLIFQKGGLWEIIWSHFQLSLHKVAPTWILRSV